MPIQAGDIVDVVTSNGPRRGIVEWVSDVGQYGVALEFEKTLTTSSSYCSASIFHPDGSAKRHWRYVQEQRLRDAERLLVIHREEGREQDWEIGEIEKLRKELGLC